MPAPNHSRLRGITPLRPIIVTVIIIQLGPESSRCGELRAHVVCNGRRGKNLLVGHRLRNVKQAKQAAINRLAGLGYPDFKVSWMYGPGVEAAELQVIAAPAGS